MSKDNFTEEEYIKKQKLEEKKTKDALAKLDYDKVMGEIESGRIKKRSFGVTIFALLLIISNIPLLPFVWTFFPVRIFQKLSEFALQIPTECLLAHHIIPSTIFVGVDTGILNFCAMLNIICGLLILRFNNVGRLILIVWSGVVMALHLFCIFTGLEILRFLPPTEVINRLFFSLLLLLIPLLYIIFLTRPKVKEQFK